MINPSIWSRVDVDEIHPDLRRVANLATTRLAEAEPALSFIVTEGNRGLDRQKKLISIGASRTLRSRHIGSAQRSKRAEAIDVAATVDGEVRWDWPLYARVAKAMKRAARDCGVAITWGGDWKSFKDGPHFELKRL